MGRHADSLPAISAGGQPLRWRVVRVPRLPGMGVESPDSAGGGQVLPIDLTPAVDGGPPDTTMRIGPWPGSANTGGQDACKDLLDAR